MPSRQTFDAFIALVEQGKFIEAIEGYYTADATMQENQNPPRRGRDTLIEHERQVMATFPASSSNKAERALIDGDLAVVNWVFKGTAANGEVLAVDELALQRWSGDRIVAEQFYYDPAQLDALMKQGR